jgi:hypothetical protein
LEIVFVADGEVDLALPFLGDLQDAVAPVVASLVVIDVIDVSRFTYKFSLTKMLTSALSLLVNFTKLGSNFLPNCDARKR